MQVQQRVASFLIAKAKVAKVAKFSFAPFRVPHTQTHTKRDRERANDLTRAHTDVSETAFGRLSRQSMRESLITRRSSTSAAYCAGCVEGAGDGGSIRFGSPPQICIVCSLTSALSTRDFAVWPQTKSESRKHNYFEELSLA